MNIKYEDVPAESIYCLKKDCPLAAHCLHSIAADLAVQVGIESFMVYNPDKVDATENCPHYRSDTPVTVKLGMARFFDQLPYKAVRNLRSTFENHFGHTQFHRIKHGQLDITPSMQAYIQSQLNQQGITTPPLYDGEADRIMW